MESLGEPVSTFLARMLGPCVLGLFALSGCGGADPPAPDPPVPASPAPAAVSPAGDPAGSRVLAVLHAWDTRRAEAWTRGDAAALGALYVADSRAGRDDVELLRRYLARGLVVEGWQMQVLAARVLVDQPDRIRVEVTDRVRGGVVRGGGVRQDLPRDRATTRVLELRRVDGEWLMSSVAATTRLGG